MTSLRLIALGGKVLPSQLAGALGKGLVNVDVPEWCEDADQAGLSEREIQILRSLVVGRPNKEIARDLHVAEATVKVHVKAILRKLGVANRTQAAVWAIKHGFREQQAA